VNNAEQQWGPWKLALRVIDEPVGVFRQLSTRPTSWVPMVLLVVVTLIMAFGTPAEPIQEMTRQQMESAQQRSPDRITDEMVEDRVERAASPQSRAIFGAGQIVFYLIAFVVVAAVLMLVFGAMGTESIKFKAEFAIVAHAFMPQLLGFILIVLLTRFAGFDELTLSLGFLFDAEASPFLSNLGTQFTLFGAWNMVLLALGNQIKSGSKSLGGPLMVVGGLWVTVNLLFAGLATAFAGLAG
jgi:fumarate reductase subunit D